MNPPVPVADPSGSEAQSGDHNSCGPRAAAAWVRAYGGNLGPLFVPDFATADDIVNGINGIGQGFHAVVEIGDPETIAAASIPMGRGLVVGVNCLPDCTPVGYQTGIRHWLCQYTADGWCFNDWNQTYQRYSNLSAAHNSLMGTPVIWRDGWTPPTPTPQGDDMYNKGPADLLSGTVRLLYRQLLHREVDAAGMDQGKNVLQTNGLDALIAVLQDSPEGRAVIAAERKALGL